MFSSCTAEGGPGIGVTHSEIEKVMREGFKILLQPRLKGQATDVWYGDNRLNVGAILCMIVENQRC